MNRTKLIINRVVVKRNGSSVYDQAFHKGINVIRGKNSTGKSTIMELISYGLGADIKKQHWKREALLCDEVLIDVKFNQNRYVLKRPIEGDGSKPPIYMKEGNYQDAVTSPEGWNKYGYRKTDKKVSFATRIFDLLGYEQHTTSDNESLTIHQLFRLIYADQDTPASNIFRWESLNYDKESMRTAIGEFLFGFDDLTIHSLRQKLLAAENSFNKLDDELKAVYSVLGRTNIKATTLELTNEIVVLNNDLIILDKQIQSHRRDKISASSEKLTLEARKLNEKIASLSHSISILEDQVISLSYDIEENEDFLKTLEYRKQSIKNAQVTVNSIGMVEFEYCPSCLRKLPDEVGKHECKLCKSDVSEDIVNESYLQAMEQIDFQYKETLELINKHRTQKTVLLVEVNKKRDEISKAKSSFTEINSYTDDYELNLTQLASQRGYIESQIQSLNDKLELAAELDSKIEEKSSLQITITKLQDQLQLSESKQANRKRSVLNAISNAVVKVLSMDTGTEDSFNSAGKFEFDFGQNIMLLDGRANFSASSNVLLKNSFHLATFLTACEDDSFRIPCFGMFDNIEDKGMTEDRSRNFQSVILELCAELKTDFQVLMTTSMVDEALDNEKYGVGPYYDKGQHTLDISL